MWIPVDNPHALTDEGVTSAYIEFGLTLAEAGINVTEEKVRARTSSSRTPSRAGCERTLLPLTITWEQITRASDDELVAAYMRDGKTRAQADDRG